ncbi:two-component response regulator ORR24-like [Vicia villosa]|uniref:two-component response regulator ORR24-like n=1 Tax=Vicia villosa TaxID=3911 RepID=UPI00273BEA66|nr:two-component response regulator ORR24-like [Vicia villosa]
MVEDQFPIGMRVLVVEDDLICLKNLERLLQECQYNVTIAQSGITALNMLSENKNNFDMLMTNVQIPDIDGFMLLELVGMHLPVILFSSNDDPRMVMRGVLHGACDYLVKPIRMEKLQLIWQHVIRKKAVPRKILHIMNVENLTNQNVASHLQKYRLYLKRISSVENQQTNMVTAIGRSSDTSYSRISSLSEVGDYLHALNGSTEINRHKNPLMMESKKLVETNSNLQISYAVPMSVVESGGNLDYNYWDSLITNAIYK